GTGCVPFAPPDCDGSDRGVTRPRSHALRLVCAQLACVQLALSACSSSPAPDGAGGASGGGPVTASGGTVHSGGSSSGGTGSSGGSSTGGTSGGATSTGGIGTGGSAGEVSTGGSQSGGGPGSGGAAGTSTYGPCDETLGTEDNPACAEGEVCANNTCAEVCPTDPADSFTYECPEATSGDAPATCSFAFGRCNLVCQAQGGDEFDCPAGMLCELSSCVWPPPTDG